jgi:hypothetical protein
MVFDRLSRKQTAASIGQQAKVACVNRSKYATGRSSIPTLPKRSSTSERDGETMDSRMSLQLDELQMTEQAWTDDDKSKNDWTNEDSVNALLDHLLDMSLPLPSSLAPQENVTKLESSMKMPPTGRIVRKQMPRKAVVAATASSCSRPASYSRGKIVTEPTVPGHITQTAQSVFERLYHQGTKASVGQQVESVRRKTLLKWQTTTSNNSPNTKSSTTHSELVVQSSERVSSSVDTAKTSTTCLSNSDGTDSSLSDAKRDPNNALSSDPRPIFQSCCEALQPTPGTIYTTYSDESSVSTVSNLVEVESTTTPSNLYFPNDDDMPATDPPRQESTLNFLLLSKWSSTSHCPWKMALKHKMVNSGEKRTPSLAEPLYLRSMSNVLYDFANHNVSEAEVATALITALFHRDFEYGKYWTEETTQVSAVQDGEYIVQKAATSLSTCIASTVRTLSSAHVKFDYTKRMITVVDYYHG